MHTYTNFAGMETLITATEAWADFWAWIRLQESWSNIPRRNKQYLYKAEKAHREDRLGSRRIERILTQYAPGRYEFREVVILHNEKSQGG